MPPNPMSPALLASIAQRFKALAEPTRLRLLQALREGETTVSDLVERTGLTQANVSKHLDLLYRVGFVARRKEGVFTRYRLADRDVFRLCDLICGRIEREMRVHERMLRPGKGLTQGWAPDPRSLRSSGRSGPPGPADD